MLNTLVFRWTWTAAVVQVSEGVEGILARFASFQALHGAEELRLLHLLLTALVLKVKRSEGDQTFFKNLHRRVQVLGLCGVQHRKQVIPRALDSLCGETKCESIVHAEVEGKS